MAVDKPTMARTPKGSKAKAPAEPVAAAPSIGIGLTGKRVQNMNELDKANKKLKTALAEMDKERAIQVKSLQEKEDQLLDRLSKLEEEKLKTAAANGNVDISEDDFLEINAGGKIIAVKRATLTQLQGTRMEAMFSGRWDEKLIRDGSGRIFLDVNGDCFQAIVDYLNELAISSEDEPPERPCVDDELQHILAHQMDLFGLTTIPQIESIIIKESSDVYILHDWLEQDGSDGELELLYRSSRDGLTGQNFHSKCDNKGQTVVMIETTEGGVVGGYTNTAWKSQGGYTSANKAFLFAMSGFGLSSPVKMKLRNTGSYAIYNHFNNSLPIFGNGNHQHDLKVNTSSSSVTLYTGNAYEHGSEQLTGGRTYNIKEMEVFQVNENPTPIQDPRKKQQLSSDSVKKAATVTVNKFSKEVNDAINEKWSALHDIEVEVLSLEESFKDEEGFIESFGSGDTNDLVVLNVSGTMMAASRATLLICEDSVLAQQFDDTKWTEQGSASAAPRVKDWTPDEVTNWVKGLKDIPDDVATLFWENDIKGSELLALDKDGLKMIGVKRAGTICLLLKEIKQLEEASQDTATLIEYSPYCFGKILDYLRLKRVHTLGLLDSEPTLPSVCDSQKKRFEKVVKFYFPGKISKFILG
jgi:hypothetical protein